MNSSPTSILFSDGACSGNPGPGGFGAIACLNQKTVKELGGSHPSTTNNQMELLGAIEGLEWLHQKRATKVEIWTDSSYVINGITKWVHSWKNKNWTTSQGTSVLNKEYWERLLNITSKFPKGSLSWKYVPGHQGVPGNERCDEIAVLFSKGQRPQLYEGPLKEYSISLEPPKEGLKKSEGGKKNKGAAKSYLSLFGGEVIRHSDWASCERRVKGRSGAKFKKSTNTLSEQEILSSWGLPKNTPIQDE